MAGDALLRDELNDRLSHHLACPVCSEFLVRRIFQCKNGHPVCESCKTSLSVCPACPEVDLGHRCLLAEHLAEEVMFRCDNHLTGCDERFSGRARLAHHQECFFREHTCLLECSWSGNVWHIEEHIRHDHAAMLLVGDHNEFLLDISEEVEGARLLSFENEIFWYRFKKSKEDDVWLSTVQYLGHKELTPVFRYTMELCYPVSSDKHTSITFSNMKVHHETEDIEDIYALRQCLSVDFNFVYSLTSRGELRVCYNLKKLLES